jgi:hypothetical protein
VQAGAQSREVDARHIKILLRNAGFDEPEHACTVRQKIEQNFGLNSAVPDGTNY